MSSSDLTDDAWRARLPPDVYDALRRGRGEAPHTGVYEKATSAGTYHCAGCGNVLFDSEQKILDDSGYAAFSVDDSGVGIQYIRTYSEDGGEHTAAVCAQCQGRIGMVGSTVIRREEDFAQGTAKRCVHAFSRSITLRKSFTPRNYPLWYVGILCAVGAGMFAAVYLLQGVTSSARLEHVSGEIDLVVSDIPVHATIVPTTMLQTGISVTDGPLFVICDHARSVIQTTDRTPLDILWLDSGYHPSGAQLRVTPDEVNTIEVPSGARFALIAVAGTLQGKIFSPSASVYIEVQSLVK